MKSRKAWFIGVVAFAIAAPAILNADAGTPREAQASVSVAVRFDRLVARSHAAVIATPLEQKAQWEEGKIFTYTRVRVEENAAGELATGNEAWVVTRGGIVDDIGQSVDGEAVFHVGHKTFVFLAHDSQPNLYLVTSRAQGQFQIKEDATTGARTFGPSVGGGMILQRPAMAPYAPGPIVEAAAPRPDLDARFQVPARDLIVDRRVEDVFHDVASIWATAHASPAKQ